MISKESHSLLLFLILNLALFLLLDLKIIFFLILIFLIFTIFFFRDPIRIPPKEQNLIVSPADGKILDIKTITLNNIKYHQIIIFLSIFNVHINRIPLDAQVITTNYTSGKFYPAYKSRIENHNERMETILNTQIGTIKIVQIAGLIARRIVNRLQKHQNVKKGEKFGMIKFSSRTDLYLPVDKVEILISKNDLVFAGEIPVAKII